MTRTMLKITPDRLASPIFSAAGVRAYIDANGVVQTVAANVARDAHYEQGARTILLEGSGTNLVTASEQFDVGWVRVASSVTANATAAPSGAVTADKLVEDTSAAAQHRLDYASTVAAGTACWSLFAKAGERTKINLRIGSSSSAPIWDLSTGTITGTASGYTLGIQALGSGWYRCWIAGACALNDTVRVNLCDAGGNIQYTGDGASGVYLWGAQVEQTTLGRPSSYVATAGAAVTRAAELIGWRIPDAPHAMEWAVEFFEHGAGVASFSAIAAYLGNDAGTGARLDLRTFGTGYLLVYGNGASEASSGVVPKANIGDRVKLRGRLSITTHADGTQWASVQLFQSLNGGAEVASTVSPEIALASTWGGQTFRLNSFGNVSHFSNAAYISATLTDTRDFPALAIDGVDARTAYGFALDTATGWRDAPAVQRQTQPIPGRAGATLVGLEQEQPRALKLSGTVIGSDAGDARAKLDAFIAALRRGDLPVAFADLGSRQLTAALDGLTVTPGGASMLARKLAVDVALTCLDPYAHDVDAFALALSSTPTPLPLGTAPVRPVITCTATAACTNPTLTLTDADGNTVATFALTVALVAGDVLVIDCDAMTITLNGASRLDVLTSGDFLVLDVASQGDFSAAAWPNVAITFATGTPATTVCSYARAWRC